MGERNVLKKTNKQDKQKSYFSGGVVGVGLII